MKQCIEQILDQLILKHAFIADYPKPGVIFLAIDPLFNDPACRKMVAKAVNESVNPTTFDAVASIASRGYLFSGIIASKLIDKGEYLVQKVKVPGDPRYVQLNTSTEYSADALQILQDTIQPGKKYLLTDDLIATGGSVTVAIKLIRQCGGHVDTVLVMTELTDFNARLELKRMGVELVSLLKFSQQDLAKLLILQQYYEQNPSAPINYSLKYHEKGVKALTGAAGNEGGSIETAVNEFTIKRMVALEGKKPKTNFAQKGIFFTASKEVNSKPINFYNHGCPIEKWHIDPEKVARNQFQVFATGDAFTVISPDMELSGSNVIIHVGLQHPRYSPLLLVQEALQLCRCAYEHGSKSITVALPEQFHPVAHFSDFNSLLLRLFEASGANKIYFYDESYSGKLDDSHLADTFKLTIASHSSKEPHTINIGELDAFLQPLDPLPIINGSLSLDHQILHFSRKRCFERELSLFCPSDAEIKDALCGKDRLSELQVPEIMVQPHIVLCGSVNQPLANKIVANLRMRGELVRLYLISGEGAQARIPDDAAICGAIVTIIQSTRPSPDDMEASTYQNNGASPYLFTAANIARQAHLRGAETINLINPYQFNARSDKAEDNAKGKTGAYVQQNGMLLAVAGVNHVITAECHDNHTMTGSYTGLQIRGSAISAISILAAKLAKQWLDDPIHPMRGQLRLVAPDAGAAKRTKELTELLQSILGHHLCQTRILGEKQRDSHKDDSALISSLNSGNVGINPNDRYLITDDETATGSTLCQAVENLALNGAKEISVLVAHNNMPLDWLSRQLCLAKFLYLGVNDLHFSDTHEMGSLAKSYDHLISTYSERSKLAVSQVEAMVFNWFKDNIAKQFVNKEEAYIIDEFQKFKTKLSQLKGNITIHSLAPEFANKVATNAYMVNPHGFEYKVNECIKKLQQNQVERIVAFTGPCLPVAAALALEMGLPLEVIPQATFSNQQEKIILPLTNYALIGTPSELTLARMTKDAEDSLGERFLYDIKNTDGLIIIDHKPADLKYDEFKETDSGEHGLQLTAGIGKALAAIETLYAEIKHDPKLQNRPIKLLGVGIEGQIIAGQLCHLLNKSKKALGIAAADSEPFIIAAVYAGTFAEEKFFVDRSSLGMGDVCIAVGQNVTNNCIKAINELANNAKVHCPYFLSAANQEDCQIYLSENARSHTNPSIFAAKASPSLFSQAQPTQELAHVNGSVIIATP